DKTGDASSVRSVFPEDEVIITAKSSKMIRLTANDISIQGRASSGVKLLDIEDDDMVSDFAVITEEK
ncbi:MAG TPA: DNA gyrase C-terminal beta-propeller domain-containing protein, partial [Spirochaetota bacterium]|nr:DNA gyrase C-terminal beta-propeller domain-containing protein [Spirochaetota bacterium]